MRQEYAIYISMNVLSIWSWRETQRAFVFSKMYHFCFIGSANFWVVTGYITYKKKMRFRKFGTKKGDLRLHFQLHQRNSIFFYCKSRYQAIQIHIAYLLRYNFKICHFFSCLQKKKNGNKEKKEKKQTFKRYILLFLYNYYINIALQVLMI